MNFRTVLAGASLAVAAMTSQADPVLVMRGVSGVDLNNLVVGQSFQVEVIIEGDTPGEVDAGGTGKGGVADGSPFLNLTQVSLGTFAKGIDWSLDPTLFVLDFTAEQVGSDVIFTQDSCLVSNLQDYGCNFASGPLAFTVRGLPEPASLALVGLTLLGLGVARRRA